MIRCPRSKQNCKAEGRIVTIIGVDSFLAHTLCVVVALSGPTAPRPGSSCWAEPGPTWTAVDIEAGLMPTAMTSSFPASSCSPVISPAKASSPDPFAATACGVWSDAPGPHVRRGVELQPTGLDSRMGYCANLRTQGIIPATHGHGITIVNVSVLYKAT